MDQFLDPRLTCLVFLLPLATIAHCRSATPLADRACTLTSASYLHSQSASRFEFGVNFFPKATQSASLFDRAFVLKFLQLGDLLLQDLKTLHLRHLHAAILRALTVERSIVESISPTQLVDRHAQLRVLFERNDTLSYRLLLHVRIL